jgi:hypothetical protein
MKPNNGFVASENSGPSFSDDWFGWVNHQAGKLGDYIVDQFDKWDGVNASGVNQVDKIIAIGELIDNGFRAVGANPVFGGDDIEASRDVLSGYENKAKDLERRMLKLQEVLQERQSVKEQANVFSTPGVVTPIGVVGGPKQPVTTKNTVPSRVNQSMNSNGNGSTVWKVVR